MPETDIQKTTAEIVDEALDWAAETADAAAKEHPNIPGTSDELEHWHPANLARCFRHERLRAELIEQIG